MRYGTALLFTALTLVSCATASTASVALSLLGADGTIVPSGAAFRPGDQVTVELDLGLVAVSTTRVTTYRVTLASPRMRDYGGAALLVNEGVSLEPPIVVTPGESSVIRWSLTVSPAMLERTGLYLLTMEVRELGVSATVRFAVRNEEPTPAQGAALLIEER